MIYTIKPLEWVIDRRGFLYTETMTGSYAINNQPPFVVEALFLDGGEDYLQANSVEHAKELAWQDWIKRLEGALNPCVIATSQSPILRTTALFQAPPDGETLKQIERVFSDSAFYTNDLNP